MALEARRRPKPRKSLGTHDLHCNGSLLRCAKGTCWPVRIHLWQVPGVTPSHGRPSKKHVANLEDARWQPSGTGSYHNDVLVCADLDFPLVDGDGLGGAEDKGNEVGVGIDRLLAAELAPCRIPAWPIGRPNL